MPRILFFRFWSSESPGQTPPDLPTLAQKDLNKDLFLFGTQITTVCLTASDMSHIISKHFVYFHICVFPSHLSVYNIIWKACCQSRSYLSCLWTDIILSASNCSLQNVLVQRSEQLRLGTARGTHGRLVVLCLQQSQEPPVWQHQLLIVSISPYSDLSEKSLAAQFHHH